MDFLLMQIDPVAFNLGPVAVRWYGILIATGIIIAYVVAQREMTKKRIQRRLFNRFINLDGSNCNYLCPNLLCHF